MPSDFLSYQKEIETLLAGHPPKTNWKKHYHFFKLQLRNLQHERLIHLLVTLTVGLATLISCLSLTQYFSPVILLLTLILLPLFGAYIFHYRQLENTTQYWYRLLRQLRDSC